MNQTVAEAVVVAMATVEVAKEVVAAGTVAEAAAAEAAAAGVAVGMGEGRRRAQVASSPVGLRRRLPLPYMPTSSVSLPDC